MLGTRLLMTLLGDSGSRGDSRRDGTKAPVAKLVDAAALEAVGPVSWGFESPPGAYLCRPFVSACLIRVVVPP